MINPDRITDYNRNDRELEEFMVFSVCAAGKNANTTARILNDTVFAFSKNLRKTPIEYLTSENINTSRFLKFIGIGCYNNRAKTFHQLTEKISANKKFLKVANVDDLESIYGIGPKTARFFIMHSRPNQRIAALDTHILKELNAQGVVAPRNTPPKGRRYNQLEKEFVRLADVAQMSVADYDLFVWKKWRKTPFDPRPKS